MHKRYRSVQQIIASKTAVAVWLGLCYQTTTTSAIAADGVIEERRSPFERRASARMGISVTVLPACAISLESGPAVNGEQPVEIRCTQNTQYTLDLKGGSNAPATDGLKLSKSSPPATQTGVQVSNYLVQKAKFSEQTIDTGQREISVLSIDF